MMPLWAITLLSMLAVGGAVHVAEIAAQQHGAGRRTRPRVTLNLLDKLGRVGNDQSALPVTVLAHLNPITARGLMAAIMTAMGTRLSSMTALLRTPIRSGVV